MLTGNLVRVRVTQSEIIPQLIAPTSPKHTERAEQLLSLFAEAQKQQQMRKDIEEWIAELSSLDVEHKIFKGFAKILLDRSVFTEPKLSMENPPTPVQVRADIFALASEKGVFSEWSKTNEALSHEQIFAQVAEQYGCDAEQLRSYLYSDLHSMQCLQFVRGFSTPSLLIHRYNIALCQAILLHANSLQISFTQMDPKWLRYLFRVIKFHKLMFFLERKEEEVVLTLDGPQSLLKQSSRYGMQLALFLPALLLVPTPWSLKGVIQWNKRKKTFSLDHNTHMRSHYQETGVWRSDAERIFEERFREKETGWSMQDGELLHLKGQRVIQPDFTLTKGDKKVHLEIVGFWRKGQLSNLLADCPDNLFLLVSKRMAGDTSDIPKKIAKRVISFAEVIPLAKVLEAID